MTAVEPRTLQSWVYSQGAARSRQREFLTFTQQGAVSCVDPELRVGSPVKKGQLIAHQAPDRVQTVLQAARAALAGAEANLALAELQPRLDEIQADWPAGYRTVIGGAAGLPDVGVGQADIVLGDGGLARH